jgi:hypothetical protein
MTYSTVEAYVKDEKIVFSSDFIIPKENMKVLVTFIKVKNTDNIDY